MDIKETSMLYKLYGLWPEAGKDKGLTADTSKREWLTALSEQGRGKGPIGDMKEFAAGIWWWARENGWMGQTSFGFQLHASFGAFLLK